MFLSYLSYKSIPLILNLNILYLQNILIHNNHCEYKLYLDRNGMM